MADILLTEMLNEEEMDELIRLFNEKARLRRQNEAD